MANIFYLIVNMQCTQAKWLSKNKNQRTNDVPNGLKSTSFLRTNVRKVTKWARQNPFAIEQCCVHWTFLYGSQVLRRLKIKLFSWWENNSIPFFSLLLLFEHQQSELVEHKPEQQQNQIEKRYCTTSTILNVQCSQCECGRQRKRSNA